MVVAQLGIRDIILSKSTHPHSQVQLRILGGAVQVAVLRNRSSRGLSHFATDDAGVMAAESETVVHSRSDRALGWF